MSNALSVSLISKTPDFAQPASPSFLLQPKVAYLSLSVPLIHPELPIMQ